MGIRLRIRKPIGFYSYFLPLAKTKSFMRSKEAMVGRSWSFELRRTAYFSHNSIRSVITLWENDFSRPNSDPLFCTFSLLACYKGFWGLRFRDLGRVDFLRVFFYKTRINAIQIVILAHCRFAVIAVIELKNGCVYRVGKRFFTSSIWSPFLHFFVSRRLLRFLGSKV